MTAKDILSIHRADKTTPPRVEIEADMPLLDILPRLLDTNDRRLRVVEDGVAIGEIDDASLLEGLGRMLAPRDDCSLITLDCDPQDYSAGLIAHAVEDTDAHLVDLFTTPGENGHMVVTLRVRHSDPTAAVRSLERYGFKVVESHSSGNSSNSLEIATERLLSLQALMNV